MPVGDCQKAFADAARLDGILLVRASPAWITRAGHFVLEGLDPEIREAMHAVFMAMGGVESEQVAKRAVRLPGDYLHAPSGTFVEIDESQHFTSHRLRTFEFYPANQRLGFSIDQYRELCQAWAPKSDRYRASKSAVGFGPGGRARQRAYNDALRDLLTPALGHPPLIRVPATDGDGAAAYARVRDQMRAL